MSRALRVAFAIALLLSAGTAAIWLERDTILTGVASLLISENPVQPADLMAISISSPRKAALEAAQLYQQGMAPRIFMVAGSNRPVESSDIAIWKLGVPGCLSDGEADLMILERSGVPRDAIVALPDPLDGFVPEIDAIADYVRQSSARSLLFIAARSHTARARWLLKRALPSGTRLIMRSPDSDGFRADSWWQTRARSREVLEEYLHWVNSFVLRDPWRWEIRPRPTPAER
jgi:uncharacterized SAM-binding protein YcdF (DUF218 family)